ncbi:hypothetical protein [Neptunomonas qingdaonensis]|uniref:Uncharacterized protein n=1 Tax=Neptunomonas qingdaonensis TaxID=1045558 RepID=A0A1I2SNY9_9GAMM|nr:hypothetical protein [Neptunomonas qingdaonensis]SFG51916.1 hypothetical protein SAMN05216175_1085 [Neptunomonas qingdaonensis]
MPFRPTAEHRRNVKGVIYPLTAAVARRYGIRNDGAYPIGAFYTLHIDNRIWSCVGGIWFRPSDPLTIENRNVKEEDIVLFLRAIESGEPTQLRSGKAVTWEAIPQAEASELPDS